MSLAACTVAVGCSRLTAVDWGLIPPDRSEPEAGAAGAGAEGGRDNSLAGEPAVGGDGGAGGAAGAGGDDGLPVAGTFGTGGVGGGAGGKGGGGNAAGSGGKGAGGGTAGNAGTAGSGGTTDPDAPTPCTGAAGPTTGALVLFAGPAKPTAARGGRAGLDADCEAERVKLGLPQTRTHAFLSIDNMADYLAKWSTLFPDMPVNKPIVGPTGIPLASTWNDLLLGNIGNSLVCAKVLPSDAFWWLSGCANDGLAAATGLPPVYGQGAIALETCEGWTQGTHDPLHGLRPGSAQIGGSRMFSYSASKTYNVNCDSTSRFAILCLAYTP